MTDAVSMAAVLKVLCAEIIGEGVHTALRKYCEGGTAAHRAIQAMPAGEWHRGMEGVARDLIEYIERERGGS